MLHESAEAGASQMLALIYQPTQSHIPGDHNVDTTIRTSNLPQLKWQWSVYSFTYAVTQATYYAVYKDEACNSLWSLVRTWPSTSLGSTKPPPWSAHFAGSGRLEGSEVLSAHNNCARLELRLDFVVATGGGIYLKQMEIAPPILWWWWWWWLWGWLCMHTSISMTNIITGKASIIHTIQQLVVSQCSTNRRS